MNNSLKALLGAALLSTILIGCEHSQTRDGQTSANSMNANTQCDGKMGDKKMDCKMKDKKDCKMADMKDCKMDGKKMSTDCPTAKADKSHCDGEMKKAMDCGPDCTKPCCADKTAG